MTSVLERRPAGTAVDRRVLAVVGSLYLVSDIGYSFFFAGLGAILLGRGVSVQSVATINALGMIYFARFLIAPVIDRVGRYRVWLIVTQLLMIVALVMIAALDPVADLPMLLVLLGGVLVLSALHDSAANGLSVLLVRPADRAIANSIQVAAATVSILIGSAGALVLYSRVGWRPTVLVLATVYLLPVLVLLRGAGPARPRDNASPSPWRALAGLVTRPPTAAWTLVVLPSFALGLYLVTAVQSAMMLAAGWTLDRIAAVQYTIGTIAGLAAAIGTGLVIERYGRRRPVVPIGLLGAAGTAALLPLAAGAGRSAVVVPAVIVTAAAYSAMGTWAFTVSMDQARPDTAATDLTAQTSVLGILRMLVSATGLWLAGLLGYPGLVLSAAVLAVAGTVVAAIWVRR